jgi:hypothetical protein
MRLSMTLLEAETLASDLYSGASSPLTKWRPIHRVLDCAWWREPPRRETFNSDRHKGALRLYLTLARRSQVPLLEHCFPSTFEFTNGERRNPDKGFIKMCLNVEPSLLNCRTMDGHLLFDVTDYGRTKMEPE